jgi:hypothetical protein
MPVLYEWDIEDYHVDGDDVICLDHDHRDKLADFSAAEMRAALADQDLGGTRLVLVRDDYNDVGSLENRQYAYVDYGRLPTHFDGGTAVPKRFLTEFARRVDAIS